MLDTLYLSLEREEVPSDFLRDVPANRAFSPVGLPGFSGRLETTKTSSPYYKRGALYLLKLNHTEAGFSLNGPVFYDRGHWEVTGCRVNIPKIIGLPPGCLPNTEAEIQTALERLALLLHWLPYGWFPRIKVKEIHLTMNFNFSPFLGGEGILKAHKLMRHPCVRLDPRKLRDHHHTLYWTGKDTTIALYEKTAEVCEKLAKERKMSVAEIRRRYQLHEIIRLEFRLKNRVFVRLMNQMLEAEGGAPHAPDDGPPLPKTEVTCMRLGMLNAKLIVDLFRTMALQFPELPLRQPKRLTAKTLAALLIKSGALLPDGAPIEAMLAQHMGDRQLREAKAMALQMPVGGPVFSWRSCLGDSGWGEHAIPKPDCYQPLSLEAPVRQFIAPGATHF